MNPDRDRTGLRHAMARAYDGGAVRGSVTANVVKLSDERTSIVPP